jgi:hypothetical protein
MQTKRSFTTRLNSISVVGWVTSVPSVIGDRTLSQKLEQFKKEVDANDKYC